jgi:hypothetical protein
MKTIEKKCINGIHKERETFQRELILRWAFQQLGNVPVLIVTAARPTHPSLDLHFKYDTRVRL